ncbi:MAG: helix-hairpin-helix domain-containing protein [Eubacteriales bacterium]|nr:helix-hairpin-helix domain-containing protein [Eubacteriales bacterium]
MKQEKWITGILCLLLIVGAGCFYLHTEQNTSREETTFHTASPAATSTNHSDDSSQQTGQPEEPAEYAVYICGAVRHPGVYRFSEAARVCDVIEAAGGFKKNAAIAAMNQARWIADGEQIEIPTVKQWKKTRHRTEAAETSTGDTESSASGRINLNVATEAELMTLPGIGPSKAKAILDYRTQHGSFSSVEDIMKVSGIKEGVYNQIKDSITV